MKHRFIRAAALFTALLLTGCTAATQQPSATAVATPAATAEATATPASTDADTVPAAGNITMANAGFDEKDAYTDWQSGTYTAITLSGTNIAVNGTGAQADGSKLTITAAGTYALSGSLSDGYILVDAPDDADVRIVLNGASITCSTGAPLFVKNADKVTISLAPDTQNTLTDAAEYTYDAYDKDEDEPSAALFSKADLVFNGTGELTVTAQHNDGITSKDSLKIVEGTFNITAKDDGIVGKDFVAVQTAQITVDAGGDGVKSTNEDDKDLGFIAIANGKYTIKAGSDGIQAETELYIEDGDFDVTTGGGSAAAQQKGGQAPQGEMPQNGPQGEKPQDGERPQGQPPQGGRGPGGTTDGTSSATLQAENTSASSDTGLTVIQTAASPAVDSTSSATVQNAPQGNTTVNAAANAQEKGSATASQSTTGETSSESYKALKAGTFLTIMGGSFTIDAQEDAVHSNAIAINGGSLTIAAGDDGIHADDSMLIANGLISITSSYEGVEGLRVDITGGEVDIVSSDDGLNVAGGNDSSGGGGNDMFAVTQGARFIISGGTVHIDASGDGLDTNGSGYITGGEVTVAGPTSNGNGALDYNGEFVITGGTLIAVGSSGMPQAPSNGTTQPSIAGNLDSAQEANTTLTLIDASGKTLMTYTPNKAYQFVAFSSPELKAGETYTIAVNGTAVKEVTLSETVTTFSLDAAMGGGGGQRQRGQGQFGQDQPDNDQSGEEQATAQ